MSHGKTGLERVVDLVVRANHLNELTFDTEQVLRKRMRVLWNQRRGPVAIAGIRGVVNAQYTKLDLAKLFAGVLFRRPEGTPTKEQYLKQLTLIFNMYDLVADDVVIKNMTAKGFHLCAVPNSAIYYGHVQISFTWS